MRTIGLTRWRTGTGREVLMVLKRFRVGGAPPILKGEVVSLGEKHLSDGNSRHAAGARKAPDRLKCPTSGTAATLLACFFQCRSLDSPLP